MIDFMKNKRADLEAELVATEKKAVELGKKIAIVNELIADYEADTKAVEPTVAETVAEEAPKTNKFDWLP